MRELRCSVGRTEVFCWENWGVLLRGLRCSVGRTEVFCWED